MSCLKSSSWPSSGQKHTGFTCLLPRLYICFTSSCWSSLSLALAKGKELHIWWALHNGCSPYAVDEWKPVEQKIGTWRHGAVHDSADVPRRPYLSHVQAKCLCVWCWPCVQSHARQITCTRSFGAKIRACCCNAEGVERGRLRAWPKPFAIKNNQLWGIYLAMHHSAVQSVAWMRLQQQQSCKDLTRSFQNPLSVDHPLLAGLSQLTASVCINNSILVCKSVSEIIHGESRMASKETCTHVTTPFPKYQLLGPPHFISIWNVHLKVRCIIGKIKGLCRTNIWLKCVASHFVMLEFGFENWRNLRGTALFPDRNPEKHSKIGQEWPFATWKRMPWGCDCPLCVSGVLVVSPFYFSCVCLKKYVMTFPQQLSGCCWNELLNTAANRNACLLTYADHALIQ